MYNSSTTMWSNVTGYSDNTKSYYAIADTQPTGIDFDLIVEQLAKLTAAYQPPAPVVTCQNCGQPTLYDRACRYCGGAP